MMKNLRQNYAVSYAADLDSPGIRAASCQGPPPSAQQSASRQLRGVTIQGDNRVGNSNTIYN